MSADHWISNGINDRLLMRTYQVHDEDGLDLTPESFASMFTHALMKEVDQPRITQFRKGYWTTAQLHEALEEVMVDLLTSWDNSLASPSEYPDGL